DDAAHAVTALRRLLRKQRLLHLAAQPFDGRDRLVFEKRDGEIARSHGLAVDHDEARAALAAAAAEAAADQAEIVSQYVEERRAFARLHLDRLAVDDELHAFAFW